MWAQSDVVEFSFVLSSAAMLLPVLGACALTLMPQHKTNHFSLRRSWKIMNRFVCYSKG